MTSPTPESLDELLLDMRLDRVTDEQRAWLRAELDRDAALAARDRRVGRILSRLDRWSVSDTPPGLADRVLGFVRAQAPTDPMSLSPAGDAPRIPARSWFRFREIIAAAACVGLLVGVIIPGMARVRDRSRRALCAANLNALFMGTSAYQQAFADSLPYAGFVPGSMWLSTGESNRVYASNSRHLFQLLRGAFAPAPKTFICPSDARATPMLTTDVQGHDDFASSCNLSYASLNLAAAKPNLHPRPTLAYLSDTNPLFERARFRSGVDPDTTNSPAHGGHGQNVLALDGHVRWATSPIYGPRRDNLWLAGNIRKYTGCETPTNDEDAQLIPGYPACECANGSTTTRR